MDDYLDELRRSLENELGLVPADTARAKSAGTGGVSLIITREQREALRARGFPEAEIHRMTPAEAHRHLGLTPSGQAGG